MSLAQRLEYAALCVLREPFRRLPIGKSLDFGASLGRLYASIGGRRVEFGRINLRIAFPEWSEEQRRRVLGDSLANIGRTLAELALIQGTHRDELLEGVRIEGLEHLEAARQRSACGGVIVVSAHLGAWELCGMAAAGRGFRLTVVHRPFENPYVEAMVRRWREGSGIKPLPLGQAASGVFRALQRGEYVLMLLDQDAPRSEAVFADFFGLPAATRSAPARLAMKTGASVLAVSVERQGAGARHVVRFWKPVAIEGDDPGDAVRLKANVEAMNRALEDVIRAAPSQWSWLHRRWRTRPDPGAAGPYPSRRGVARQPMPLPEARGGSLDKN